MALNNDIDVASLNRFLDSPAENALPQIESVAFLFAQHFSEQKTDTSTAARQRLKAEFNYWQRTEIVAYLYAIFLGNLSGNTFDALLSRLKGEPHDDSHIITELIVPIIAAPNLLGIVLKARTDQKVIFERS